MRSACLLLIAIATASARTVIAQVGMLDDRTEYAVVTGAGVGSEHGPLLAIVLWRGEPGWMHDQAAPDRARTDSIYRYTRFRAEAADLSFFGNGKAYGLIDREYRRLTVEGKEFPLAASDSALVVLVSIPSGQRPRVVTTAHISATLPAEFWPKSWQHGDTTFSVRPRFDRLNTMLVDALRRSPTIADYLR